MARPRKPSHLKLVTGNPGKRALPKNEPQPARLSATEPPPGLSDRVARCWRYLAGLLDGMGVLTKADVAALTDGAQIMARLEEVRESWARPIEEISRDGEVVVVAAAGSMTYTTRGKDGWMVRQRPEFGMESDLSKRFQAWLGQHGLTPAARSKVAVVDRTEPDKAEGYFG